MGVSFGRIEVLFAWFCNVYEFLRIRSLLKAVCHCSDLAIAMVIARNLDCWLINTFSLSMH